MDRRMCGDCLDVAASLECMDCGDDYCQSCADELHVGRRAGHRMVPLAAKMKSTEEGGANSNPEAEETVVEAAVEVEVSGDGQEANGMSHWVRCADCALMAQVECQVCGIQRCLACNETVHSKGRRKSHEASSMVSLEYNTLINMQGQQCGECDAQVAHVACMSCKEDYCFDCIDGVHANGTFSAHKDSYVRLEPCGTCRKMMAEVECEQCHDVYCIDCFSAAHTKGRRSLHRGAQAIGNAELPASITKRKGNNRQNVITPASATVNATAVVNTMLTPTDTTTSSSSSSSSSSSLVTAMDDVEVDVAPTFPCVICFPSEFAIDDMYVLECPDRHRFCYPCLRSYIAVELRKQPPNVDNVLCPSLNCTHTVQRHEMELILGGDLSMRQLYEEALNAQMIAQIAEEELRARREREEEMAARTYECPTCMDDELTLDDMYRFDCGHMFCRDCCVGHCETKINDGKVEKIPCMDHTCNHVCQPLEIQQMVSRELYEKYAKFLLDHSLMEDADFQQCLNPKGCNNGVIANDPSTPMIKCAACEYAFCKSCKVEWHADATCRQYQQWVKDNANADNAYAEFIKSNGAKTCPNCRRHTLKNGGCNRITCACGKSWCWKCHKLCENQNKPYDHFKNNEQHLWS